MPPSLFKRSRPWTKQYQTIPKTNLKTCISSIQNCSEPLKCGFSDRCIVYFFTYGRHISPLVPLTMKFYVAFVVILHYRVYLCSADGYYDAYNWKFHFPEGSSMGIVFSIAMPLDLPRNNVFMSYYFEGVYGLPGNVTTGEYPPVVERSNVETASSESRNLGNKQLFKTIDRRLIYYMLETKLAAHGYPARACILRTICETALATVTETNGVLGDLIHIIFTPSSSIKEELSTDYLQAEENGKLKNDCEMYHADCDSSFLDFVSWIEHMSK